MTQRNPLHTDAATLDDIRRDQHFKVVNTFLGVTNTGRFTNRPFEHKGRWYAHATTSPSITMTHGGLDLANLGIVPKPDGSWNRSTYCVLVSAEETRRSLGGKSLSGISQDDLDGVRNWLK